MKERLKNNFLDAISSLFPITYLITIVSLFIGVELKFIGSFLISVLFLVFGTTLFTTGADMAMVLIGENIGETLVKKGKFFLILLVSMIIGIIITVSEPDLMVLAKQLTTIPDLLTILSVSLGVGIFLMIAVFRIFKNISFSTILSISCGIILLLLFFTPKEFIPVAFDAGGVTTGPMGVPLIVAFGYGLTKFISGKTGNNDSFGLCGISSLGPIIIVLLMGIFFKTDSVYDHSEFLINNPLLKTIILTFKDSFKEVVISIIPILLLFFIFELFRKKLNKVDCIKILVGITLTIIGLALFLTGVSVGFLKIGYFIGNIITSSSYKYFLIPLGMIFGYVIVNAEPAIKLLNMQIYDLTEGSISPKIINLFLSLGVCLAIGIAIFRVLFQIPIHYFLIGGYLIAVLLSYRSSKIFTAIALDASGAASGPLTTSFLLPLAIGACIGVNGNILSDAFGVGALVSMTPLITIQLLGLMYQYKINKRESTVLFDEEIIDYVWSR